MVLNIKFAETTDILKIDGFVLKPDFAKKSRGQQFFFVNDRFIKSPYLNHAVNAAFEGLIKPTLHPGLSINNFVTTFEFLEENNEVGCKLSFK